jgi:hypothetical protein
MRFVCLYLCAIAAWFADSRNIDPRIPTHFKMPEYKRSRNGRRANSLGTDPVLGRPRPHARARAGPQRDFRRIENRDIRSRRSPSKREGYWLGGNLYRPLGRTGKFPALCRRTYWSYGRLEHTPTGRRRRAASISLAGPVVFMYDMVGYNDTMQTPHSARPEQLWNWGPLGLQLWNSIRAVDFRTRSLTPTPASARPAHRAAERRRSCSRYR